MNLICAITGHRSNPATLTCRTCGIGREDVLRDPPLTIFGAWHRPGAHPFDVVQRPYWALLRRLARPVRYRLPQGVKIGLRDVLRARRNHRAFARDVHAQLGEGAGPVGRKRLP